MATVARTWTFTADTEGLTDQGTSALTAQWDSGALALEFTGGGSGTGEKARGPTSAGKDWTVLFPGLPAGATVTQIQCTGMTRQRFQSVSLTSLQVLVRIVDSAGTGVTTTDLLNHTIAGTGTDASPVDISASSTGAQAVLAGKQAAATLVALEVQVVRVGGASGGDVSFDAIAITATYTPAGGAGIPDLTMAELSTA